MNPLVIDALFESYGNNPLISIRLKKITEQSQLKTVYRPEEIKHLKTIFSPGKKFLLDKISLYDDEDEKTHFRIDFVDFLKIDMKLKELTLTLPLSYSNEFAPQSRHRKPVPTPRDRSRVPVRIMVYPLARAYLTATFDIVGMSNEDDLYIDTTLDEYLHELEQSGGAQPATLAKPGGAEHVKLAKKKVQLDALKKQDLIDRCRAKKIPYSGRTKAELVAALRK